MKKFNGNNGITLIALIVTIIVLLILAGIAIASLSGNDNIIKNANIAVGNYNEKTNEEQEILNSFDEMLKKHIDKTTSNPEQSKRKPTNV